MTPGERAGARCTDEHCGIVLRSRDSACSLQAIAALAILVHEEGMTGKQDAEPDAAALAYFWRLQPQHFERDCVAYTQHWPETKSAVIVCYASIASWHRQDRCEAEGVASLGVILNIAAIHQRELSGSRKGSIQSSSRIGFPPIDPQLPSL